MVGFFSKRNNLPRPERPPVYDAVPEATREGVARLVVNSVRGRDHLGRLSMLRRLYEALFDVDQIRLTRVHVQVGVDGYNPARGFQPWENQSQIILKECEWNVMLDCTEALFQQLAGTGKAEEFATDFNLLASQTGCGYVFDDGGKIIRRVPDAVDRAIEAGERALTENTKWTAPEQQLRKAVSALNARPPDLENAVKDAVGALEGCAQIVGGAPGVALSQLLGREPFQAAIHLALIGAIEKLYGFRGDAGGVGHSTVGKKAISAKEADFAVGLASLSCALVVALDSERASK